MKPAHPGFKRLIDVGLELAKHCKSEQRAPIFGTLGNLHSELRRFVEAEAAYEEALRSYKSLAEKSPEAYLPYVASTQNNLGVLYRDLQRFGDAETAYKEALAIRKALAEKNPEAYLHNLLQTQANIGVFYISTNRPDQGIHLLETVLKQRKVLPDFGARAFAGLGKAYEKLQNRKSAAQNYLQAAANHFILFRKGVKCLPTVVNYLGKVTKLGETEVKGDAQLMLTAMRRLAGEDVQIPQVPLSKKGEALKEALNGKKTEFKPENEIDIMILILINDLLPKKNQETT